MQISKYIAILWLGSALLNLPSFCLASPLELGEFGWIERVRLSPGDVVVHAKLDTGADNCSLHAKDIVLFERGSERRVRFTVRSRIGEEINFDRKVERVARIKRVRGRTQERPVVKLFICLGTNRMEVDVNLVDRSNFAYPMLIGRKYLAGMALVNPAKAFTSDPQCQRALQDK